MRPSTRTALLLGKGIGNASRTLKFGGGSTLPGRVARRVNPAFVETMVKELPLGCALITGTNGKTTTATLLASIEDGGKQCGGRRLAVCTCDERAPEGEFLDHRLHEGGVHPARDPSREGRASPELESAAGVAYPFAEQESGSC